MLTTLLRILLVRLLAAVPLIAVVVTLTFVLIRLAPGDPAYVLAGDAPTEEFIRQIRETYGFDQSIWQQYVIFIKNAFHGEFGESVYYHRPVFDVIISRFSATLLLTGTAVAIAMVMGVAAGVAASRRAGTKTDTAITIASLLGFSIPAFWTGQLMVLTFAVLLRWLPVGGMESTRQRYSGIAYLVDVAQHLILPATTLAILLVAMIARFTRTAMIEALQKDFVIVARAKGASQRRLVWRHAFPLALSNIVTVIGLEFGSVVAGALLVETIFSWPGLGRLFYEAISRHDLPLLTGAFIFTAALVVMVNAATDVVCTILDPRLRA
jgi:peptide/nickel transport system permease protein